MYEPHRTTLRATVRYYPQSNGKIERFHATLKEALREEDLETIEGARKAIQMIIDHYNHVRLHSAIGYVTPQAKLEQREQEIFTARDQKLEAARVARAKKRAASRLKNQSA